jgi:hypothetical protein
LRGARGKESKGRPGRVLERELEAAVPEEKRGGKLEEEMGGTIGLEGALIGGDEPGVALVLGMPSE